MWGRRIGLGEDNGGHREKRGDTERTRQPLLVVHPRRGSHLQKELKTTGARLVDYGEEGTRSLPGTPQGLLGTSWTLSEHPVPP